MAAIAEKRGGENWELIAGNGDSFSWCWEGARSRGIEMAVIAIREEAFPGPRERRAALPLDQGLGRLGPRHRSACTRRE